MIEKSEVLKDEVIVHRYEYDEYHNVTKKIVDPDGLNLITTYQYNDMDKVISMTDANGVVTKYDMTNSID